MSEDKNILTISQLNQQIKTLLEESMTTTWVMGEISNFACPSSGHFYFSLKDKTAQVRCAMFRGTNRFLNFTPQNGDFIIARVKPTLYPPRGDYQLLVEKLEPAGEGALQLAFEQLKKKLAASGYFSEEHKKPIPACPKHIGIITSDTGAAIRDILITLKNRFPLIPITVYPTQVQGKPATTEIVAAIATANEHAKADVLILARGGGSLEDLWCFNEEAVALAIFNSQIPIITGIGHETDTTIADFVADLRAATPTAAAQESSPDGQQIAQAILALYTKLTTNINFILRQNKENLAVQKKCLRHPTEKLQVFAQQLDTIEQKLTKQSVIFINFAKQKLIKLTTALDAISPLATLNRGYAIVQHDNHVIRKIQDVNINDEVSVQLQFGKLRCKVKETIATKIMDNTLEDLVV